ncbi:hypothetical protein FPV67DRAFT_1495829 [Lyophyllum atratum]|nr:hypothetical protein FPV67DRAFT_1495829 [Lyophyllum atratum]
MPLIIHPSSCCDVCLEPLTYDEPRPPFAIPCGHIFCIECLHQMHPSICPLCRKPFIPDRSKKLITGEGEPDEDRTAVALLKKLVVSWDATGMPEAERVALVTEVERWLAAGNTHEPLAKAHEVIGAYHTLRSERHDNHRSIRHLRREIEQREIAQMCEKEIAIAVEQSLLSQVEELHTYLLRYESEIEANRKAATTITFRKNPLPRPPEPYPLENLPSFAKRYARTAENTPGHYPNGESSSSSQIALDDHFMHIQGVNADRKGKGKAAQVHGPLPLTPMSPGGPPLAPALQTPASDEDTSGPKNAIIPGASPGQRFVPRSMFENGYAPTASWNSISEAGRSLPSEQAVPVDPYSMVAEYITEYADGFEEGYRMSQSRAAAPSTSRRTRAPRQAATAPPDPIQSPLLEPPAESPPIPSTFVPGQVLPERRTTLDEFGLLPHQSSNGTQTEPRKSSRRPRRLEDFYLASSQNSSTRGLPPPPLSAPVHSDFATTAATGSFDVAQESWGTQLWTQMIPSSSPVAAPTTTSSQRPTATHLYSQEFATATMSAQRPAPTHTHSQPAPPPPTSAPAPSSSFPNAPAPRPSRTSRSRHQRRMSDMTNIDSSSWQPPSEAPPPSDSGSSLRRRSAFTGSELQTPPGMDGDRSSVAGSMSSWGTVNTANPAPASTQPIRASAHFIPANDVISVRDLHLRSFEDVGAEGHSDDRSQRMSLTSDSGSLTLSPVQLRQNQNQNQNQNQDARADVDQDREALNMTPRNRSRTISLSDFVATVRPPSTSRASEERMGGAHPGSYHTQEPERVLGTRYHPEVALPFSSHSHSNADTNMNSSWNGHRSSRSRHRMPRPLSPPRLPEPSSSPPPPSWPNETRNALGLLDIAPSPEPRISAPTPITSTRSFLRSFSHDSYH